MVSGEHNPYRRTLGGEAEALANHNSWRGITITEACLLARRNSGPSTFRGEPQLLPTRNSCRSIPATHAYLLARHAYSRHVIIGGACFLAKRKPWRRVTRGGAYFRDIPKRNPKRPITDPGGAGVKASVDASMFEGVGKIVGALCPLLLCPKIEAQDAAVGIRCGFCRQRWPGRK